MSTIILKILAVVLGAFLFGVYDNSLKSIAHKFGDMPIVVIRGVFIFLVTLAGIYTVSWSILWLFIFLADVFWIVFELTYNYFRGEDLLYVGNTAAPDKLLRKWFPIYHRSVLFSIKIILLSTILLL